MDRIIKSRGALNSKLCIEFSYVIYACKGFLNFISHSNIMLQISFFSKNKFSRYTLPSELL